MLTPIAVNTLKQFNQSTKAAQSSTPQFSGTANLQDTVQFSGLFRKKSLLETIEKGLQSDAEYTRARHIREVLQLAESDSSKTRFLKSGLNDPSDSVQNAAAEVIVALPDDHLEKWVLFDKALEVPYRYARSTIMRAVGQLNNNNPRKIEFLEKGINDLSSVVRDDTIHGAKTLEESEVKSALIEKGLRDPDSDVAKRAYRIAFQSDNMELKTKAIELGVFYPDEDINKTALWHLSQLPDEVREPIIKKRNEIFGKPNESKNSLFDL